MNFTTQVYHIPYESFQQKGSAWWNDSKVIDLDPQLYPNIEFFIISANYCDYSGVSSTKTKNIFICQDRWIIPPFSILENEYDIQMEKFCCVSLKTNKITDLKSVKVDDSLFITFEELFNDISGSLYRGHFINIDIYRHPCNLTQIHNKILRGLYQSIDIRDCGEPCATNIDSSESLETFFESIGFVHTTKSARGGCRY